MTLILSGGEVNFTDRAGAEALRLLIEAYWRERGYEVRLNIVEGGFSPSLRHARCDLRSNMVNGLPRERLARIPAR